MRAIDREKFGVRFWVRIGFVGAALVLGGCGLGEWARNGAKVGPNYAPATAPVADRWIDFKDEPEATEPPDLSRWWSVFNDPVLDGLIADAEAQNLSLRTAGERITESRAR